MQLSKIEDMFYNPNILPWGLKICVIYILAFLIMKIITRIILIKKLKEDDKPNEVHETIEKKYANCFEIITSSFCILGVSLIYQDISMLLAFVGNWLTIILLALILIGVFANNILDKVFRIDFVFRNNKTDGLTRSNMRLVSSISLLFVMLFFNINGSNSFMLLLYAGIVFGRFIFFDISIEQIKNDGGVILKSIGYTLIAIAIIIVNLYIGYLNNALTEENSLTCLLFSYIMLFVAVNVGNNVIPDLEDLF